MFKAKTFFMSILLISSMFAPTLVGANAWTNRASQGGLGEIGSQAYGEAGGAPQKNLQSIVASVIKVFLSLLGIIFVVLLIFAGFKYMTSAGDEEKIKEAVSQIRNSIIGILIVVAAYSITYFVTVKVVNNIVR
jgi:cytochrome bd-type quinol oxidase subunit 2